MFKKTLSLLLAVTLLSPVLSFNNSQVDAATSNVLKNTSFEAGDDAWTFKGKFGSSGSGFQTNNPHTGSRGFFLDGTDEAGFGKYAVEQTVTIPYNGIYNTSAYIATGGSQSSFGVRQEDGTVLTSLVVPSGANYSRAHQLAPIALKQDDKVTVYVNNGMNWTNGDDIVFEYEPSSILGNLMNDDGFNQMVRIPHTGPYVLTAMVSGDGEATISMGAASEQIVATETPQKVTLKLADVAIDTVLDIAATGEVTVTDYSLLLDLSQIENNAPVASAVSVSGIYWSGETLTGHYTFDDIDEGQTEGNSIYQWYSSETVDGNYEPLEGKNSKLLDLNDTHEGKYYKFSVTPVDSYGMKGVEVLSDAVDELVKINYVRNYSFDIEEARFPKGWAFNENAKSAKNATKAHTGVTYGFLPANTPAADLSYAFTVDKTGFYDLSMYINATVAGTEFGVRYQDNPLAIKSMQTTEATTGYEKVALDHIVLEKGSKVEVYAKGGASTAEVLIDDIELIINSTAGVPDLANLFSFVAEKQFGNAVINRQEKTITFKVPYGTDVTALDVAMEVSAGATISPSTVDVNFTAPVAFTITNNDVSDSWTVVAETMEKTIALHSSNVYLQDAFNWAVGKTRQFVMTGKRGAINKSENSQGDSTADFIPSYWAGYYDRGAFYSRDFVHQATGGQIAGLDKENFSMFEVFAKGANESRKWYTLWAFNFDGSNYTLDYKNDNNFVREVPAQFELVQRAYEQYRWTGDERYVQDETMFNFYTKVMTDYVELHDSNGNGLAEGTGTGSIFAGSSTYNERGSEHPIESGDSIGSQYQAMLAYSGILKARGEDDKAAIWSQKAADLKTYFNEVWSVKEGYEGYARGLAKDGTKYDGFGKENSWFMPMKLITEPGQRNEDYLAFIEQNLGTGIGTTPEAPGNIEAYTYIPDMYFPYNKADLAWKWMKYIIDIKDQPHERPVQGTNGDYPEISFTFVSHVIEGMMGIEPNAGENSIITAPRLPSEVNDVEALNIPVGEHEVNVKHTGLAETQISNVSSKALTWEARFYGNYYNIKVDGTNLAAKQKDINGVTVSYVTVTVPANGTLTATAVSSGIIDPTPELPTEKPTELPKENIKVKPNVDANGKARVAVSNEDIKAVLQNNQAQNVNVIIDVPAATSSIDIELSKNAVGSLATSDKELVITTSLGDVRLDQTTLAQLAGNDVVISIENALEADGKPAVTVTISANGKPVNSFDGVVTISIPYAKNAAEINENVVVYYMDGNNKVLIPNAILVDGKIVVASQYAATFVVGYNPNTFTDITNHWAKRNIDFVTARELFSGVTNDTFAPNETITRGMLVTVLGRLYNAETAGQTASFTDVSVDKYYAPYIAWANESDIVNGIGNGKFEPDQALTREELAKIIVSYANFAKINLVSTNAEQVFTDEEAISSWALASVKKMQAAGIIEGKSNNVFHAKGTATRAEVAKILNMLINKTVQ